MKNKLKSIETIENYDSIKNIAGNYNYQKELTSNLDKLDGQFNQELINEIVLWKVNRYAKLTPETFTLLNQINKDSKEINTKLTKEILTNLLNTKGIRLPMASTILRFKNPNIYQIIDQRVFRFIYGEELKISSLVEVQTKMYLDYLTKLKEVCSKYGINFLNSDRELYQIDKEINKRIRLK